MIDRIKNIAKIKYNKDRNEIENAQGDKLIKYGIVKRFKRRGYEKGLRNQLLFDCGFKRAAL